MLLRSFQSRYYRAIVELIIWVKCIPKIVVKEDFVNSICVKLGKEAKRGGIMVCK